MSVLVQFTAKVPDVERFQRTSENWVPRMEAMGAKHQRVYVSEADPNEVTMMQEWDSAAQMTEAWEKYPGQFDEEAGAPGLDWETRILLQIV